MWCERWLFKWRWGGVWVQRGAEKKEGQSGEGEDEREEDVAGAERHHPWKPTPIIRLLLEYYCTAFIDAEEWPRDYS